MRHPTNHCCLGLRLEQLSLGHLFRLADASSPFLEGGKASIIDLSNAVFICSQPWRWAARDSGRWWFDLFQRVWSFRCRKMDLVAEQEKFLVYFREETDFPLAKQDQHNAREFGSPWWWRLLAIMMADFHLTEDQALDASAMKAALLFTARAEAEGKLTLWTKSDADFDSFCTAMDAQPDLEFPQRAQPANN